MPDQAVLVGQERADEEDAGQVEAVQVEQELEGEQQAEGDEVQEPGDDQGAAEAEALRDGPEAALDVELVVLAGVNDVEPGDPRQHGRAEEEDDGVEGPAHRDPGPDGGHAQGQAEEGVRGPGEPLREGVEEDDDQGDGGEGQAEGVELVGREDQGRRREGDEGRDRRDGDDAGGEFPAAGAGVGRVDAAVHQAIKPHGRAARPDHCHDDIKDVMPRDGGPQRGQQRAGQGKRKGEDAVGELDHASVGQDSVNDFHRDKRPSDFRSADPHMDRLFL